MRTLLLLCACAVGASAVLPSASALSVPLSPHPRLLLDDAGLASLRARIVANASGNSASYYSDVLIAGQNSWGAPLTPYINCTVVGACRNSAIFGAGAGYIDSGGAANIILSTALLHRLNLTAPPTAGAAWADRAIAEMLHLSNDTAFPSWYWPVAQALERAAVSFAVAVGYDWLYDAMSAEQRATVEAAINSRTLQTRLQDERQGMWWTQDPLNWNQNSNGPLAAVALAVADVPALAAAAQQVLAIIQADIPASVASWAPYGIWPEGPGYSSFTLGSLVEGAASLQSATGDDWGLLSAPGVCGVGLHNIYHVGPSGGLNNWADGHPDSPATPALFYTATSCNKPAYAVFARTLNTLSAERPAPALQAQAARSSAAGPAYSGVLGAGASTSGSTASLNLLWQSDAGAWTDLASLPTAAVFADPSEDTLRGRKTHYGSFRSCWAFGRSAGASTCPSPVWAAFKGGHNHFDDHGSQSHNNHGHLDIGTFVLESGPEHYRWAIDLGADNYDYPLLAYFGRFRFGYHFLTSSGHNTLQFDSDSQHRRGSGAIVSSNVSDAAGPWATIDMSSAYGGSIYALRTFRLGSAAPHAFTVTDAWQHPTATAATWRMHTAANVTLNGSSALLASPTGQSSLRMDVSSSVAVSWAVETLANPYPESTTYEGGAVYVLTATVPASAGQIAVTFTPLN